MDGGQVAAARQLFGDEHDPEEASVGVLGWLGFVIINVATCGIIQTSDSVAWGLGFGVCAVYTALLAGFAVCLERRDSGKYRQFVNLLWVLAVTFVLVLGCYLSFHVISPLFQPTHDRARGKPAKPELDVSADTLGDLLPGGAHADVRAWAAQDFPEPYPGYVSFGGSIFFTSQGTDNTTGVLMRTQGDTVSAVSPGLVMVNQFTRLGPHLCFLAARMGGYTPRLWRVDSKGLDVAELVVSGADVLNVSSNVELEQLFADEVSAKLYIRARYACEGCSIDMWADVETILVSDGTAAGTRDLRGEVCSQKCREAEEKKDDRQNTEEYGERQEDPRPGIAGMLLLGVLPMMALAGGILATKKLPGVVLNLLAGFAGVVACLVALFSGQGPDMNVEPFMKWFLTAYTAGVYVALAVWSIRDLSPENWLEEARTWVAAAASVSFFLVAHWILELPFGWDIWWALDGPDRWSLGSWSSWALYALLIVVQGVLAAAVSRTVPMICVAFGLFELAWYVAVRLVQLLPIHGNEWGTLARLALLALQGMGIIGGAVFYAGNRKAIQLFVRATLTGDSQAQLALRQPLPS